MRIGYRRSVRDASSRRIVARGLSGLLHLPRPSRSFVLHAFRQSLLSPRLRQVAPNQMFFINSFLFPFKIFDELIFSAQSEFTERNAAVAANGSTRTNWSCEPDLRWPSIYHVSDVLYAVVRYKKATSSSSAPDSSYVGPIWKKISFSSSRQPTTTTTTVRVYTRKNSN